MKLLLLNNFWPTEEPILYDLWGNLCLFTLINLHILPSLGENFFLKKKKIVYLSSPPSIPSRSNHCSKVHVFVLVLHMYLQLSFNKWYHIVFIVPYSTCFGFCLFCHQVWSRATYINRTHAAKIATNGIGKDHSPLVRETNYSKKTIFE